MLQQRLMVQNENDPDVVSIYAFITLARIFFREDTDALATWSNWAGATSFTYLPRVPPYLSAIAIFTDSTQALVVFEGTVDPGNQLWSEIIYSAQVDDPLVTGDVHSFFLWIIYQRLAAISAALSGLSVLCPVTVAGHSLGGALAEIYGNYVRTCTNRSLQSILTTGSPRAGNSLHAATLTSPYVRVVAEGDYIPGVPTLWQSNFLTTGNLATQPYVHARTPWVLRPSGLLVWSTFDTSQDFFGALLYEYNAGYPNATEGGVEAILSPHYAPTYLAHLSQSLNLYGGGNALTALSALNAAYDAGSAGNAPPAPTPLPPNSSAGVFGDPNLIMSHTSALPTVPPADVGVFVERITSSHVLVFLGGNAMAVNTFKRRDRRLLTTLQTVISQIQLRDARTLNPKPTRTLSNRIIMFPNTGTAPTLATTLNAVLTQATVLLNQQH